MLDINLIRTSPKLVKGNLERRKNPELLILFEELVLSDSDWKKKKAELDNLRSERNKLSLEINQFKKAGKSIEQTLKQSSLVAESIKKNEQDVETLKLKVDSLLLKLPNLLHESVPYGKDDSENFELRKFGKIKKFDFELKSHAELAENLGIADFERSAKISGNGFYFLKGELALLNQALLRFAIDNLSKKGYTYIEPPLMMRRKPYEGVTDLSDFEKVMYKIEGEDQYMIATSEHPMASMYMNETLDETQLPLKFVGNSLCFRKEVGSRGVDTKGLFRTHQFNKVEQFIFCRPEDSWKFHEELIKNSEEIFQALDIPFRVVNICTGDIGSVAAKKYDIEAWMPRQNKYAEVVSGSNCTDYQARRLNIKFGKEGGEKQLLHTLNCTGVATSRALVAILENYQNKDGTITVPKVLLPYMNGIKVIGKK